MSLPVNEWDKDGKYHPDTPDESHTPDQIAHLAIDDPARPPAYKGPELLNPIDPDDLSPAASFLLRLSDENAKDLGLLLLQKGAIPLTPMSGMEILPSGMPLNSKVLAFVSAYPEERIWLRDSCSHFGGINCHGFCHSRAYMILERTYTGAVKSHMEEESTDLVSYLTGKGFVIQDVPPQENDLAVVFYWQNSKGDGAHSAWFSEFQWAGKRLWESQMGVATCRILHQQQHYTMIQDMLGVPTPPIQVDYYLVLKDGFLDYAP